jgi:Arc/MetJ-type ribon-helix-helix transcriptional regulator
VDVTLQPEIEEMVLERVRRGEYSSTSDLVNTAVKNLLDHEHVAAQTPGSLGLRSLELARDAPANLEWIERNREAYMGEWVALYKGRLIAHGKDDIEVVREAQSKGIKVPLMHRIVPEEPAFWAGW